MLSFSPFFLHIMFKQHYQSMIMHNALDKMSVTEGSLSYTSEHECELGGPVNKCKCDCKCKSLAAFSLP